MAADRLRDAAGALGKRAVDVVVAGSLLVATAPVSAAVAVAIKLDSPGPVLYRARRVGRDGVPFDMLKFRKMGAHAGGLRLTAAADERLTRVGRVLARTKLDELPQLWNVVRGEMSMVGPRPEDPAYHAAAADAFGDVLTLPPGITGVSQLVYVRESEELDRPDPETYYLQQILPRKLALDCAYVAHRSLAVDIRIMLWTLKVILTRRSIAPEHVLGSVVAADVRDPSRPTFGGCAPRGAPVGTAGSGQSVTSVTRRRHVRRS